MPELIECPWCADASSRSLAEQVRVLREALNDCADALESCYNVQDYPANGNSQQDLAASNARSALAATAPQPAEGGGV